MFISKKKLRKLESLVLLQEIRLGRIEKILSELAGYDITSVQKATIEHKECAAANLEERLKKINEKINKK